jgi:prevent-host-death family protein
MIVNVRVAKDTLGRLVKRAEAGEEVIIARNGKPAVRMTPVGAPKVDHDQGSVIPKSDDG